MSDQYMNAMLLFFLFDCVNLKVYVHCKLAVKSSSLIKLSVDQLTQTNIHFELLFHNNTYSVTHIKLFVSTNNKQIYLKSFLKKH